MRLFIFIIAFTITMPLCSYADVFDDINPIEVNGIFYFFDAINSTAEVASNPSKYTGDIVVPSNVTFEGKNYIVTRIGKWAFWGNLITSVILPNTIIDIDEYAFSSTTKLKEIYIPSSVKNVAPHAFDRTMFSSFTIPSTVENFQWPNLAACPDLAEIKDESNHFTVIDNVVYSADKKTILLFPKGKKNEYFEIPEEVTKIGDYAFNYTLIDSIAIPNTVTYIGNSAFNFCYRLKNIKLPDSLTWIGESVFSDCYSLKSIYIPNSVTNIGDYAFLSCHELSDIDIPCSVVVIGVNAFALCPATTVKVHWEEPLFYGSANIYDDNVEEPDIFTFSYFSKQKTLIVPKGTAWKYKETVVWRHFNVVEEETDNINNMFTEQVSNCKMFNIAGQRINTEPQYGIYIKDGVKFLKH